MTVIVVVALLAADVLTAMASSTAPIVSSCPSQPSSPCWTQVQSGSSSCTIATGGTFCTSTITYSPAYSTTPFAGEPTLIGTATVTDPETQSAFMFTQNATGTGTVANAESFDTSALTSDQPFSVTPFAFTIAVTPNAAGEFGVIMVYADDSAGGSGLSISSLTDTQGNAWTSRLAFTLDGLNGYSGLAIYTATLSTNAADTITVNMADSNPSFVTDYAGGTVELFKNVQAPVNAQKAVGSGTSDTVSITPRVANDFIVGGAVQAATFGCGVTLSAPTTTRQADANCVVNFNSIDFASGDQHPSTTTSQTFADTGLSSSGDVIAVLDLTPTVTSSCTNCGEWTLTTSTGEFQGNTWHRISTTPPLGAFSTTMALHFTCTGTTVPGNTITFSLTTGSVSSSATGLGSSLCNGLDQAGAGVTVTGGTAVTVKLQGNCVAPCTTVEKVWLTSVYFTFNYSFNFVPTASLGVTATAETVRISISGSNPGAGVLISFKWWAAIAG